MHIARSVTLLVHFIEKSEWKRLDEAENKQEAIALLLQKCSEAQKCEDLVNLEHGQHFPVLLHCVLIQLLIQFEKTNLNHTFIASDCLRKIF